MHAVGSDTSEARMSHASIVGCAGINVRDALGTVRGCARVGGSWTVDCWASIRFATSAVLLNEHLRRICQPQCSGIKYCIST
jgi:hypothetical protein